MLIQYSMDKYIRRNIPTMTSAKAFIDALREKFMVFDKGEKATYLIDSLYKIDLNPCLLPSYFSASVMNVEVNSKRSRIIENSSMVAG